MAAKSKTPRKRPVKKTGKKERTPAFFLVVIVIAVVAIAVSYFYLTNTSEEESDGIFSPVTNLFTTPDDSTKAADESLLKPEDEAEEKTIPVEQVEKTIIEGTWVSTLNGAMLSFEGNRFKLEFPSIEKRAMLQGHFKIMGGKIHLVNTLSDDLCGMENGTYSFTVKGEDLILKSENDPCKMRKENLSTDWFKL